MTLSPEDYRQARAALINKKSWIRYTNQTIGGAKLPLKLMVTAEGSWFMAKPNASFEDDIVKGKTLEDFDRQIGWCCPTCNFVISGNISPCPICASIK